MTAKQQNNLSDRINDLRNSQFASAASIDIMNKYKFSMSELSDMTDLVKNLYLKKVPLDNLEKQIVSIFGLDKKKSIELAKDICAKRLLIVDQEVFDGKVAEKLKEFGDDPDSYSDYIKEYLVAFDKEQEEEAELEKMQKQEEAELTEEEYISERLEEVPKFITDPEGEKRAAYTGFKEYLTGMLRTNDFALKIDLNIRLVSLLMADESKKFQKELLDAMYENAEKLTEKPITLKGEKVDPAIGNWLKDYISFVGVDEVVSSIKKAQYFTQSENVRALSEQEKNLLDKLLDVYIEVKNFYVNLSKYDLEEVKIFALSDEEQEAFIKDLESRMTASGSEGKTIDQQTGSKKTIDDLIKEKVIDEQKINSEKERIITETRKEFDKVADIFEDALLKRSRYPIIACLEILAEVGALDNLLAKDVRFKNLLFGYFKRNNLQSEEAEFNKEPYQAKYIQHFLRYVLLERIGLSEEDGARFAVKIANIFRSKGVSQYAQLAYLDLSDNKFKWSL